jgi:hypothetical protein
MDDNNSSSSSFSLKTIASKFLPTPSESVEEAEPDISTISLSLEDIFINLTLLSKIDVGDKLIQNGNMKHINIDTSYFQFITRWFKGSNRNNSLKFINHVLNKAFEYNDNMLEEKSEKSAVTVFRLTADLKNSLNGLNNLKQTYSTDKLIQSELDVMIDNVRTKLDLNSKNLNFINNPTNHFLP